jgi:hypothetical protein
MRDAYERYPITMRCTPMRDTPMRDTPMRDAYERYPITMRDTPMRHVYERYPITMRDTPMRHVYERYPMTALKWKMDLLYMTLRPSPLLLPPSLFSSPSVLLSLTSPSTTFSPSRLKKFYYHPALDHYYSFFLSFFLSCLFSLFFPSFSFPSILIQFYSGHYLSSLLRSTSPLPLFCFLIPYLSTV